MQVIQLYRAPGFSVARRQALLERARSRVSPAVRGIDTEWCFNVGLARPLDEAEHAVVRWLLAETFEPGGLTAATTLAGDVLEVGPRLSFTTAYSTNAVAMCRACGLEPVLRLERSRRYRVEAEPALDADGRAAFAALVHDRMTECVYATPLADFDPGVHPEPVRRIPVLEQGRAALEEANRTMGLAFDDWDLDYYLDLFTRLGRNPTTVELFDVAQSNSEHSRHWFFKGRLVVDGEEVPHSLLDLVRQTYEASPAGSVIAFADNSSAIRGFTVDAMLPARPGEASPLERRRVEYHLLLTAETHNFPSGVAPFPGAETGTGGRIRDVQATGRAALVIAGTTGYSVGNLQIPGYPLPWEADAFAYPGNLASPLDIELEASNGASDYGNKFGEPVVTGFTRSLGLRLPDGERREWLKPIMFSGGIGQLDARHVAKGAPRPGMRVVKVGGPAYRIGMGGGAASSMVGGANVAELDFNAVQRGDAEMEQKLNRVIRACSELADANPVVSIHDQGAGGNCNVLKEIVEPAGARIELRDIPVGDATLSALEIWGAEYQENDALLADADGTALLQRIGEREKVPVTAVGEVTGDGRIVVHDAADGSEPVDLALADVLGEMPRKVFELARRPIATAPLELPPGLTAADALDRVLRLLSVGSKRFLTSKVDRSVSGLVAQQPCCGPLQLTVADVAVVAQSHLGTTGGATAIGEQPVKGLVDPAAMARMSLGEALTNLVWARVTSLPEVRCSANWMWAAKLPGEGARLHDAVLALRDAMLALGVAVDGGKDSLSMAALAPDGETVKGPGTLVVSAYGACPDVTATVTPDLELRGEGRLLLLDLAPGRHRLGGSALAQVYGQVGDEVPDLDDPALLGRAFAAVQELLERRLVRAGHDRSDGGLLTALLEMAFAGDCGLDVDLPAAAGADPLAVLFAEELGLVLEVAPADLEEVRRLLAEHDLPVHELGASRDDHVVRVRVAGEIVLEADARDLRDTWEATSFQLERLQRTPELVRQEEAGLRTRGGLPLALAFTPEPTAPAVLERERKPRVAILREEGSNGDRELAAAFLAAGFEPWDVTTTDLVEGRVELARFTGLAACGGFSYADVLDAAKGWAGVIRFHDGVRRQFDAFVERPDTFSLGVCNGCQLFALLGLVPWRGLPDPVQPRFIENASGRFESRFAAVRIVPSPSVMLRGMEGSTLGIWVAHGEGRALFPDAAVLDRVLAQDLAPVRWVDDAGETTEAYPFNPNGSPAGIAALCSPDGRHLAIMPHPERAFLPWQWGFMPPAWRRELTASPWLRMFQNARAWVEGGAEPG